MPKPKSWPATVALPGVVSEGTLKEWDLINAFEPVLARLDKDMYEQCVSHRPDTREESEEAHEYLIELWDALDLQAPEGYYFGAVEGDGACFGFFEVDSDG